MATGKLIIFQPPQVQANQPLSTYLLTQNLNLSFSISAHQPPSSPEKNGMVAEISSDLLEEFRQRIANNEFLEYEEVYLKSVSTEP